MKALAAVLCLLVLAGCSLPPPDQPAHFSRMGRFLGLVANCGCSDISPERMLAEYRKALADRYSESEAVSMRGHVDLAATEQWHNHAVVCGEVCGQRCMVQAVVEPLGGRGVGVPACPVTERDLHLTDGANTDATAGPYP
ncbi:hypothetical protein [Magnetospirillum sp. SS-4]|uniref:hypothetical protein n=1 Tax=Magnetospirillum sp. SS-4 TaxID=2681465 RepID=UPI00137C5BA1|nr:hypothetical protein [Magnetospirillum sp. SS-4]CAA7627321.1 conserved hypothetical protein [Magnetospirillum sp. SS-4]